MRLISLLNFFSFSNLLYLKKKYSISYFKKFISYNYKHNDAYLTISKFIDNNVIIEKFLHNEYSIQEILDNNFYVNNHIDEFFRANDFSVILIDKTDKNEIFDFLKVWSKTFINSDIFFKFPLENSIRLNHLIWYLQLYGDTLDKKDKKFLTGFIVYLTRYCYYFIEKHLKNNHTLIESKNLLIAGIIFQKLPVSKKWIKNGTKILQDCLSNQIDDCGVHIERSSMYQKVVLSELIELEFIINVCENSISSKFKKILRKKIKLMTEYDSLITFRTGIYPMWGDGYLDDRLIRFLPSKLYNTNREKFWGNFIKIDAYKKNKDKFSKIIRKSGYNIFSNDLIKLIFNSGRKFSNQNFAKGHLHSDLLGFVLYFKGEEVIINSGTYNYSNDSIKYFRGTRGHNTIMIDGLEQHTFQNNKNSREVGNGYILSESKIDDDNIISSYHDGYKRIGVKHERQIVIDNNNFKIIDNVVGNSSHSYEYFIHFSPKVECEMIENNLLIKGISKINFSVDNNCKIELLNSNIYDGAWRSISINEKEAIQVLRIQGIFQNSLKIETNFLFFN